MNIPGISEILSIMKQLPESTDKIVERLDKVIDLMETTNFLLHELKEMERYK